MTHIEREQIHAPEYRTRQVPSCTTFRETLIRIDPDCLDRALQGWNAQFVKEDEGLAIDGKTMRNASVKKAAKSIFRASSAMNPVPATPPKKKSLPCR